MQFRTRYESASELNLFINRNGATHPVYIANPSQCTDEEIRDIMTDMELITINHPKQIDSRTTYKQIEEALKSCKTYELNLICQFVAPDEVMNKIYSQFQVLKNKIAFKIRP